MKRLMKLCWWILSTTPLVQALWNGSFFSPASPPVTNASSARLRVAQTQPNDLPIIADMLSKAVNRRKKGINAYMDQLFAKQDILQLLSVRNEALRRGRSHLLRLQDQFPSMPLHDQIKLLWNNDNFRRSVETATQKTGEQTFFTDHNMAITPPQQYLQHLQVTAHVQDSAARDASSGIPVGFCEVAMLSDNNGGFIPSISNLCTSPDYRRRGIATRLLNACERYTTTYWEDTDYMGLFVEQDNHAAIALYEKSGYRVESEAAGGDLLGPMFHMRKYLKARTDSSRCSRDHCVENAMDSRPR